MPEGSAPESKQTRNNKWLPEEDTEVRKMVGVGERKLHQALTEVIEWEGVHQKMQGDHRVS